MLVGYRAEGAYPAFPQVWEAQCSQCWARRASTAGGGSVTTVFESRRRLLALDGLGIGGGHVLGSRQCGMYMEGQRPRRLGDSGWVMFLAVCLPPALSVPLASFLRPHLGFGWSFVVAVLAALTVMAACLGVVRAYGNRRMTGQS